jgi:hypothetical protein
VLEGAACNPVATVLVTRSPRELQLLRHDAPDFYARIAQLLSRSYNGHAA